MKKRRIGTLIHHFKEWFDQLNIEYPEGYGDPMNRDLEKFEEDFNENSRSLHAPHFNQENRE